MIDLGIQLRTIWLMIQHALRTFGGRRIELKSPGGGAPPPTHSWRTCARGLVLAGVLGVLGFLGILATNLKKFVPEPVQIAFRGLKNRAWDFKIKPGAFQDAIF